MKRLPTTLDKLTEVQAKLDEEAARLRKRRDQLARQQQRLERKAHDEALRRAGMVVHNLGIPLEDLGTLEALLKCGLETYPLPVEQNVFLGPSERQPLAEVFPVSSTAFLEEKE